MTTPDPGEDAGLDARVRAAADRPFDDIAMTRAVLARVHAARRAKATPRSAGWRVWFAPVAFASVLVATPFLVAGLPQGALPDEALLLGLATGDPGAILGGGDLAGIFE